MENPNPYMTRTIQREIVAVWRAWNNSEILSNETYTNFFFDVIQADPRYRHFNVYEVLDLLVNEEDFATA